MAPRFRVYGKKRGHRRSGSKSAGRLGAAIVFGALLTIGVVFFAFLLVQITLPEWRANNVYVQHECTVLDKRIGESRDNDGSTYRPEILIRYEFDGAAFETWTHDATGVYTSGRESKQAILDQFVVGQRYPCWYDPDEPQRAVLDRGFHWFPWLILLLPGAFVAIGGVGLLYAVLHGNKSAERVAAGKGQSLLPGGAADAAPTDEYPAIPSPTDIVNSPGTILAYRLPIAVTEGWALFGMVMACLFWNGIVSVFVTIIVRSHLAGDPEWFLTIFMIPFVLVGLFLVLLVGRQLLIATGVGPTTIEISHHPLRPGESYEACLTQAGRLTLNSLSLALVCTEEVTYRQGTNTRTERREVLREALHDQAALDVQPGIPYLARMPLRVPPGAMHSFRSDHNQVTWKLVVKGDIRGWPNFERDFPLVVYPAPLERSLA